jgi:hypothetical protein
MRIQSFVPWILVGVTAFGGAGIGPVLAQAIKEPGWPPAEGAACKPTKKDVDEAKILFGLGKNAHDTSNYSDAIKYYKDAYKRDCSAHLLLKNLGKVYEADAQYAAAVEAYKLYRQRGKPAGDELDQIDAKIANLTKRIPPPETTAPPTTTVTPTAPPVATTTAPPVATEEPPTPVGTVAPVATNTVSTDASSGPGVGPYVLMGAGGAVLIVGGVLFLSNNSKLSSARNEFEELRCGTNPGGFRVRCNELADTGNSATSGRNLGAGLAVAGVGLAVGGLIWFLVSGKKADPAAAQVVVTPGPGFAGLGLSGTF